MPADLQTGQFYWGQDSGAPVLAGALRTIDQASGTVQATACQDCPCWSDISAELRDGAVPLSFGEVLKGLVKTQKTVQAVTIQTDTCSASPSTREVPSEVPEWFYDGPVGVGSVFAGTVRFLAAGTFGFRAKVKHVYQFNAPDRGCFKAGESQPQVSASAKTQAPSSLQVISVSALPTGTLGDYGCTPLTDWGIKVRVKYQVLDQDAEAIKSGSMEPQETITGTVLNGVPQGDPVPNWTDIGGPDSRISGVMQYTTSAGRFDDAPLGACANAKLCVFFQSEDLHSSGRSVPLSRADASSGCRRSFTGSWGAHQQQL